MKTPAPGPVYPPFGTSPWPIPYQDFRRFREAGITGSTARFHDSEADKLEAAQKLLDVLRRDVQQLRIGLILMSAGMLLCVAFKVFG